MFTLLLPALSLSHLQFMLSCKSPNKPPLCISDDGFALGCAFFLTLLSQEQYYQSIRWIQEIHDWGQKEKLRIQQGQGKEIDVAKEMSQRKLDLSLQEIAMWGQTLDASMSLFKEQ